MNLITDLIILVVSMLVLVKGADLFVDASSNIAKRFGVSQFIIGLTLVSVGTSLPEIGAAVSASLAKNSKIVIGNIVGSNIANIALVLGIAIVIHHGAIKPKKSNNKFIFYLVLTTSLFFLLSLFSDFGNTIGLLFIALFITIIYSLKDEKQFFVKRGKELNARKKELSKQINLYKESAIFVFSLVMIILGAKFIISPIINIAVSFGISELFVSLIVIAIGTSIPELVVSISSTKKKKIDMFLGNIIGSNISNLMLIGGVSAVINPLIIDKFSMSFTIPIMLLLTIILALFVKRRWEFKQIHGVYFLIFYFVFIIVSFFLQN